MKEELLKGLTEEQIAKVKACKSQEEMLAFAKEEGIELSDEQLEAVSGRSGTGTKTRIKRRGGVCPFCHSGNTALSDGGMGRTDVDYHYKCYNCGKVFPELYTG